MVNRRVAVKQFASGMVSHLTLLCQQTFNFKAKMIKTILSLK